MKRTELKVLRAKHGYTQQKLADMLGVNVGTYNLIENGKSNGSNRIWQNLQRIYNLSGEEMWNIQNQNKRKELEDGRN